MANTVLISDRSRYKDTPIFDDGEGDGPVFALLEVPEEFTEASTEYKKHTVADHEIGFLDKLASRYFGQGQETLWWGIAIANNIISPEEEMFPGQVLLIPPRNAALQFISRAGNA